MTQEEYDRLVANADGPDDATPPEGEQEEGFMSRAAGIAADAVGTAINPGRGLIKQFMGDDTMEAFDRGVGNLLTLGLDDEIRAGVDTAKGFFTGGETNYMTNLGIEAERADTLAEEHPMATLAGTAAGVPPTIMAGTAIGTGKVIGALAQQFPKLVTTIKGGGLLGFVSRTAVASGSGAAVGGLEAAFEGKPLTPGLIWGAGGGVLGAAAGDALGFIASKTFARSGKAAKKAAENSLVESFTKGYSMDPDQFPTAELLARARKMPEGSTLAELDEAFMADLEFLASSPKAGREVKQTARAILKRREAPSASIQQEVKDIFGGPIKDADEVFANYKHAKKVTGAKYQELDGASDMLVNKADLNDVVNDTLRFTEGGTKSTSSDMKNAASSLKREIANLVDADGNMNSASLRKFRKLVYDAKRKGRVKTVGGETIFVDSDTAHAMGNTYKEINERFMHNPSSNSLAGEYKALDEAYTNIIGTKTGFDEGTKFLKPGYPAEKAFNFLNRYTDGFEHAGFLNGIKTSLVKKINAANSKGVSAEKQIAGVKEIHSKIARAFDEKTADELVAAAEKAIHIEANAKLMEKAGKRAVAGSRGSKGHAKEMLDVAIAGSPGTSQAASLGAAGRLTSLLDPGLNAPTQEAVGSMLGLADNAMLRKLGELGEASAKFGDKSRGVGTALAGGSAIHKPEDQQQLGPLMSMLPK